MKWCEKCQVEYEDFAKKCSDCGSELITSQASNKDTEQANGIDDHLNLKHLYTGDSNANTDVVLSLLNASGINTEIRRKGSGAYLHIAAGINYQGTEIFVSEEDYSEATDILSAKPSVLVDVETENNFSVTGSSIASDEHKFINRRRNRIRFIILLFMGVPALLLLINWVYNMS